MEKSGVQSKKRHILRFWLVMLCCTAMIGAACWFAYTQTRQELRVQLETTVGSIREMTVTEIPTDPAMTHPQTTQRPETRPPETTRRRLEEPVEAAQAAVTAAARSTEQQPSQEALRTETAASPTEPMQFGTPVAGEVMQPYSAGELVKSPTTGVWQTHNGTDLAAALGDSVYAAAAGTVSQITEDPLWGITITIDHKNGYITRYCNLGTCLSVTEGDAVEKGSVLGAVGQTADAESGIPSHLHFEVLKDGKFIDPETILPQ